MSENLDYKFNHEVNRDLTYYFNESQVEVIYAPPGKPKVRSFVMADQLPATQTLTVKRVMSCKLYDEPKLLIVCADSTKKNHFFWHCVITKSCNRIDFDNPIMGDIAQAKITRDPFEVNYVYKTLESGKKTCYALVIGISDGSSVLCLLNIDSSSNISVSLKYFDQDNDVGHVTSIYILPQDADDKRMGHHDPQILLGYSKGAIRVYRFRAILYSFRASRLRSPVDLSEFAEYPGYPITHLSCARTYNSLKFIISFSQENPNNSAFGNTQSYVKLIEFDGSQRKTLKLINPPSPSSLITETHLMPHYEDNVDFTIVFYSPLSRVYTISVWLMDSKKNIKNMLEKKIDESTCIKRLDHPKCNTPDTVQYLLENPEKIVELAFPLQAVGLKRKATVDFYKESLEAIEQPNKRMLPKTEHLSGESSEEEEEISVTHSNSGGLRESNNIFLNGKRSYSGPVLLKQIIEDSLHCEEPEEIDYNFENFEGSADFRGEAEGDTQDPFVWIEKSSKPIKLDTIEDLDSHVSDQEDFIHLEEDFDHNEVVSLGSQDDNLKQPVEATKNDDLSKNPAFVTFETEEDKEKSDRQSLDVEKNNIRPKTAKLDGNEGTSQSTIIVSNIEQSDNYANNNLQLHDDNNSSLKNDPTETEKPSTIAREISPAETLEVKETTTIEDKSEHLRDKHKNESHQFLENSANVLSENDSIAGFGEDVCKGATKDTENTSMGFAAFSKNEYATEAEEGTLRKTEINTQEIPIESTVEANLDIHEGPEAKTQNETYIHSSKDTTENNLNNMIDTPKGEDIPEKFKDPEATFAEEAAEETSKLFLIDSDVLQDPIEKMEEFTTSGDNQNYSDVCQVHHSLDEPMSLDQNDTWMEIDPIETNTDEPMEEDSFMMIDGSNITNGKDSEYDEDMLDDKSSDKQDQENEYSVLIEEEIEDREQEYGDEKVIDNEYTSKVDEGWSSILSNNDTDIQTITHLDGDNQTTIDNSQMDKSNEESALMDFDTKENLSMQTDTSTDIVSNDIEASPNENSTYFELPEYDELAVEDNKSASEEANRGAETDTPIQSDMHINLPEYEEESYKVDAKDEQKRENTEDSYRKSDRLSDHEKEHIITDVSVDEGALDDKYENIEEENSKNLLSYDEFYDAIGESQENESEPIYLNNNEDTITHRENEENKDEFVDYQEEHIKEDYDEYLDAEGGFDQTENDRKENEDFLSFEDTTDRSQNVSVTSEIYPEYEEDDDKYSLEEENDNERFLELDEKGEEEDEEEAYEKESCEEESCEEACEEACEEEACEEESCEEEACEEESCEEEACEEEACEEESCEEESCEEEACEEEACEEESCEEESCEEESCEEEACEEEACEEEACEEESCEESCEEESCEEESCEEEGAYEEKERGADEVGERLEKDNVSFSEEENVSTDLPIDYDYSHDEAGSCNSSSEEHNSTNGIEPQSETIELISDSDEELSYSEQLCQLSREPSYTSKDMRDTEDMELCETTKTDDVQSQLSESPLIMLVASYNVNYYKWGRKKLK